MSDRCDCCGLQGSFANSICNECNLVISELGNKYKILGGRRGGMAIVYKAHQMALDRIVALKVLQQEFVNDKEIVLQFIDEAKAAASLHHQNIMIIHDVSSGKNLHYITMEFLDGQNLVDILRSQGPLTVANTLQFIIPIAHALDYIHQKGFVHRDVKSSNIIITNNGRSVLTDFGIVYSKNSINAGSDSILGTPEYMSPEQARGLNGIAGKSDLYSLGVVLYECLTGKVPLKANTPHDTLHKVINENPIPPSKYNNKIPRWLDNLIINLLSKTPNARPENGNIVAQHLSNSSFNYKSPVKGGKTLKMKPGDLPDLKITNPSYHTTRKPSNKKIWLVGLLVILFMVMMFAAWQITQNQSNYVTAGGGVSNGKPATVTDTTTKMPEPPAQEISEEPGKDVIEENNQELTFHDPTENESPSQVIENQETNPEPETLSEPEEPEEPEVDPRLVKFEERLAEAKSLENQGNVESALELIILALEIFPSNSSAINYKTRIEGLIEQARIEEENRQREEEQANAFNEIIETYNLVMVNGGTFKMGNQDGASEETPAHEVKLNQFYIGKYEVTQQLWKRIMNSNPSMFKVEQNPVENVSWNEVQAFIQKLNMSSGLNFRLPTEAEWEFAARGGNRSLGYKYSGSNSPSSVAWHEGNSNGTHHNVTSKGANELGIKHMSGNVWEWCQDNYSSTYYSISDVDNPKGPPTGNQKVIRGGGWFSISSNCNVYKRKGKSSESKDFSTGFRLVLEVN